MNNLSVLQKYKLIIEEYNSRIYSTDDYTFINLDIYHKSKLIGTIFSRKEYYYITTPYYSIIFRSGIKLCYRDTVSLDFDLPMQKDEYFNLSIKYPNMPSYVDIEYYINNRIDKNVLIY